MKRFRIIGLFLSIVGNFVTGFCGIENWEFQGEILIFKPTFEQSFYVIDSSNNRFGSDIHPSGKRFNNSPGFDVGFRLQANPCLCCLFNKWNLRATFFHSSDKDSKSGGFLFDTTGFPGNGSQAPEDTSYNGHARHKEDLYYAALDAVFFTELFNCFPEKIHLFFGLQFMGVWLKENISSEGTSISTSNAILAVSNHLRRDSHFWGIGPEIGVDFHYFFPCCCHLLSLVFNGRASLLASYHRAEYDYTTLRTGPDGVDLRNSSLWRVNPAVDVKMGLNYCICSCYLPKMCFEIGYELIWISDCIDAIYGTDVAFAGDSIDVFSNLSLQGPYASVSIEF